MLPEGLSLVKEGVQGSKSRRKIYAFCVCVAFAPPGVRKCRNPDAHRVAILATVVAVGPCLRRLCEVSTFTGMGPMEAPSYAGRHPRNCVAFEPSCHAKEVGKGSSERWSQQESSQEVLTGGRERLLKEVVTEGRKRRSSEKLPERRSGKVFARGSSNPPGVAGLPKFKKPTVSGRV